MKTVFRIFSCICILSLVACGKTTPPSTAKVEVTPPSGTTVSAADANSPASVIAAAAKEVKSGKAILLDVREQSEWDEIHFADAILVPMSKVKEDIAVLESTAGVDKSKTIYTHCKKGKRAAMVAEAMQEAGYNVVALEFSFEELQENGFDPSK